MITDSFFRRCDISPALQPCDDGTFESSIPPVPSKEYLDEPCYFLGVLSGHFGHSLVEMSARLWPFVQRYGFDFGDVRFVGFRYHAFSSYADKRAGWLNQLLRAYGVQSDRLSIIDWPSQCRSLLVPSNISPYRAQMLTPDYNAFMWETGDRLLASGNQSGSFGKKLYLSRSKLTAHNLRFLGKDTEQRIDKMFMSHGYQVLHTQEMSLCDQVAAVRGATHIAGPRGSQMHLVAFCDQPDLKVLRFGSDELSSHSSVEAEIARHSGFEYFDHLFQSVERALMPVDQPSLYLSDQVFKDLEQYVIQHSA